MEKKYSNKYVIETGIGLQDVDRIKNSTYFINESNRYINGEITLEELDNIITSYYEKKADAEESEKEADEVSIRIAKMISNDSFTFSVGQFLTIHKILFQGILDNPGKIRTYNFTKKEWVLDGDSVSYGDFRELELALQYDFDQERKFRYNSLSIDEVIEHLAFFVSNLWQIHAFEEGNTRTTAVFFIKYLRSLGFNVTNDTFAKNAWYFRNSLVRSNYNNVLKGIYKDNSYLIKFLKNLLLNENNDLRNRDLHVSTFSQVDNTKENKIINIIKYNSKITVEELAKELNISTRTVKSILKTLVDNNKIERIGGKRYGYWSIKL